MSENAPGESLGSLFFASTKQPTAGPVAAASSPIPVDPAGGPAALALDAAALRGMDDGAMRQEILLMLACLQRRPTADVAAGPLHPDGTLRLDSMTAVWVIATIGKAFGRRLVRLSEVDRDGLRSVAGLASLVRTAIRRAPSLAGAA